MASIDKIAGVDRVTGKKVSRYRVRLSVATRKSPLVAI